MKLTSEVVRDFWAHMQQQFESKVEQKQSSATMQIAATFLDLIDVQDRDQFMKDFVTTVGGTIYIPFEIGVESDQWPLWVQLRICVHEHQHVVQGGREGWATFGARYLTSSSWRAGYEAEAYGCDLEMEFWRTGKIIDLDQRVASLKHYGCKAEDIAQARDALAIRASVVAQGVVENRASIVAIEWLDAAKIKG